MLKSKLKLSLIEDYIKLLQIEKLCLKNRDTERFSYFEKVNNKLKSSYENLMFKFGLMDVSLLVLKKEIQSTCIYNKFEIKDIEFMHKEIINSFTNKIKLCKLTDVEIDFLTKPLISNC